ncbi:sulfurtransferase [Acuticoccus yangtzensis]|uniref:sulfurtransferase n=1 Tax=Acuticoccus yangtzensis TaxID=1443441 RepID=UPI0009495BAB|nr:sulfurtransferase [Acuticoccus yangtzensis]
MLITPEDLKARLGDVAVLDASWHMPDAKRDAGAEFAAAHIPGALRFDIDRIADTSSGLPHTLPSPEVFAEMVGALGISNSTPVVVYETGGVFAAPRAWWMFRVMGHDALVLDGGLKAWTDAGYPTESGPPATPAPATFTPTFNPDLFASGDDVAATLAAGGQVADARSAERYEGRVDEPRPGLRAGHMPGARNVHYASLVTPDGRLKDEAGLRAAFEAGGVDLDRKVTTSCGSGVTASILTLALAKLGTPSAVYDGSWTEWGGDPKREVVKGPADATD